MKTAGIIAEFNPFHNGHAALIEAARGIGVETIVTVMSGNFVQRGSPAVTDKRVRAKAALLCGADLVLELPLAFSVAPAQRFARGAVELLRASGCVDGLVFGSECGDIGLLRTLSEAVENPAAMSVMKEHLRHGMTFAKARHLAVQELLGQESAAQLAAPNNALAIEYLRAAAGIGWDMEAYTLRRAGASHDSETPEGAYASASWLRYRAGDFAQLRRYVPSAAADLYAACSGLYPSDPTRLESAILAHLRRLDPTALAALPDLSEGLENRLYAAIRTAPSLSELEAALKTKRYTLARVRRLILSAFLGLTCEDARRPVPYLRVLGFTQRGRQLLSEVKRGCSLPVSQSLARLREQGGACARFAALEERATDLYALSLPTVLPCGYEYTASAVFLKDPPRT